MGIQIVFPKPDDPSDPSAQVDTRTFIVYGTYSHSERVVGLVIGVEDFHKVGPKHSIRNRVFCGCQTPSTSEEPQPTFTLTFHSIPPGYYKLIVLDSIAPYQNAVLDLQVGTPDGRGEGRGEARGEGPIGQDPYFDTRIIFPLSGQHVYRSFPASIYCSNGTLTQAILHLDGYQDIYGQITGPDSNVWTAQFGVPPDHPATTDPTVNGYTFSVRVNNQASGTPQSPIYVDESGSSGGGGG
jgi:hypothetical protein